MTRLIVSLAALLISLPALAGDLRVGFGNVDVTPELGKKSVFMAGFGENRLAVKVHDPIMARAVVFDDGKSKIAMACVDVVVGIHDGLLPLPPLRRAVDGASPSRVSITSRVAVQASTLRSYTARPASVIR